MKEIMEKIAKADRMLAAISVSGDNVLWMTDARRELGDAYRMLGEREKLAESADRAEENDEAAIFTKP